MKADIRAFREEDIPATCEMWNASMKGSYLRAELSSDELRSLTFGSEFFERDGSFAAEEGGKVVGCVLSFFNRPYENDMFWHFCVAGWIGAIVVDEHRRRQGIGRALMRAAEDVHGEKGRPLVFFGGGEGMENIVAGVQDERADLDGFLRAVGYSRARGTCWIDADLAAYSEPEPIREKRKRLEQDGFEMRLARAGDEEALARYLEENGTKGWEARVAGWKESPSDWVVAAGPRGIVGAVWGFHIANGGRAGYGNILTLPAHRNRGVGGVMLATVMAECQRRGARSMPLWTRPSTHQRFYGKLGFHVACSLDVYGKTVEQELLSREWIGRFWGTGG